MLGLIQFDWRPVLEITLLAVGIYYVFTFVRGTRGASIVTGFLAVVLTLSFVTAALDLVVLRWLLGSITTFFVVAILVIFQPEIRRMLAQVGNLEVFGNVHEQRENIEVIIQTAERLSEVRIGALIAIEQTNTLQDMVESGVPVDCVATPEMLETIFFPNNAIHDGGVILKGDRITHAACIFPLTRRQDLNKSLGTRHRAAIGLSEETDAVIVAVSEETGAISYAYKGQFTRGVNLENLRSFLSSILVRPERPRTFASWLQDLKSPAAPVPPPPPATIDAPAPAKPAPPAVMKTGTDN